MSPPPATSPPPARQRWRWFALVAFVALLWAVVEVTGLRDQLSLQAMREGFAQHRAWGFAVFTALFVLGNLAHVPGGVFFVAAVLALGPLWGALTTYVAACISCTVTFIVVRTLGADALRELKGKLARRLFAQLDATPVRSVVLLRLIFHSVPALNYTLALSGVRLRDYVLGTMLGLPLPIVLAAMLFDTLARWFGWMG